MPKDKTPDTIPVTPTPPEAQVTDATNGNPGPIPDGLHEGDTAAPDAVMSFAALGARLIELQRALEESRAEVDRLAGLLHGANGAIVSYQADIETFKSRAAQIEAAEADGNAVIYVAPDCLPWLKATVHEAKHGYTTQQQYAAAQSIEAQCDAITEA